MTRIRAPARTADAWRARVANRLLRARGAAGMTLTDAARALGASRQVIRAWETRRTVPSAARYAHALDVYGAADTLGDQGAETDTTDGSSSQRASARRRTPRKSPPRRAVA